MERQLTKQQTLAIEKIRRQQAAKNTPRKATKKRSSRAPQRPPKQPVKPVDENFPTAEKKTTFFQPPRRISTDPGDRQRPDVNPARSSNS